MTTAFFFYSLNFHKMPKIKFSALVSGMSGKSNGSVFGSNNGGAYFRNNTSKTKTKTALNAKRKSLFSEVSGAWRNLTSDQQNSWRNAVANFVVQNAFGDNRTPTGYELFMRLNNVRLEQGLPMLPEAPTPRSLPSLNDLEMVTPDQFLFMPTFGITNFNMNSPGSPQQWNAQNVAQSEELFDTVYFVAQYSFGSYPQLFDFSTSEKGLLSAPLDGGEAFKLSIVCDGSKYGKLKLNVEGGSGSIIVESKNNVVPLFGTFSVCVYMGDSNIDGIQLYLDGQLLAVNRSTVGTFSAVPFGTTVFPFHDASNSRSRFACSDFRIGKMTLSEVELSLLSMGYIDGRELQLYQMSSLSANLTIENYNENFDAQMSASASGSIYNYLSAIDQNRLPKMTLETTSTGSAGMVVYIYATPCISFGRVTSAPNKKLLSIQDYSSLNSWDVSQLWLSKFGRFSPNGYIQYFLQVSDSTTGVVNASQIKPPKRRRFKAGAELSGAVN